MSKDRYVDENGYERTKDHSNLWHRKVAYHKIYLKNRKKYPLPFSKYEVHHKDGNKRNNHYKNLQLVTPEEHIDLHHTSLLGRSPVKSLSSLVFLIFGIILAFTHDDRSVFFSGVFIFISFYIIYFAWVKSVVVSLFSRIVLWISGFILLQIPASILALILQLISLAFT